MIEIRNLTKRFGRTVAVDDLSFDVHPGRVTGFLGPNGSGKSTTLRCMVGLDRAQRGVTTFDGRLYASMRKPLFEVGALFDAGYVHPARSGRNHLRWLAATNGIATARIDECLGLVGLTEVAGRKVRGYSLGMRQRLGLAGVLLGDPHTVLLDEPANGLDPEGIRWIRDVLVHLARQGKTVLVSSHLLGEMALMADDLVVIGRGRLIEQGPVDRFIDRHATRWVRVRTPAPAAFAQHLRQAGAHSLEPRGPDGIEVGGLAIEHIGEVAARTGTVLHELSPQTASLEDAFLKATAGAQEYRSGGPGEAASPTGPLTAPPLPPPGPAGPPPAPPFPGGRAVIDAIRAEWIKFSTLLSSWVMVLIAVAFPLVIVLLTAALTDDLLDGKELAELVVSATVVSALVLGTLGVLSITGDYGHNTIRPTFAALPDRWRSLLAKPIVQVAVTAVVVAGIVAGGWIGASALAEGSQELGDDGVTVTLAGIVLLAVGLTILGYGLGLLVRNSALAICILLLWPLIAEGLIAGLLEVAGWEGLQRWLPYQAGFNLIEVEEGDESLSRIGGALWFFAWVAVISGLGMWSAKRRDA